jgi:hypothetical protein
MPKGKRRFFFPLLLTRFLRSANYKHYYPTRCLRKDEMTRIESLTICSSVLLLVRAIYGFAGNRCDFEGG